MKAFELKALLSRIDPNAEVLVTTADPKGHGSFANPVTYVFQDRSVMDGATERQVLVLGNSPVGRVWAAKAHGKPSSIAACTMRARHRGHDVGTMYLRDEPMRDRMPDGADRLSWLVTKWGEGTIDLWASVQPGWSELVFQSETEARGFAERCEGITIEELVAR